MIRFDSGNAWRTASRDIRANHEVLLALAGVFFMLPWLAFLLFVPEPPLDPAASAAASFQAIRSFLRDNAGFLVGLAVAQSVGSLAVLTMSGDSHRPTAGEAIRRGALGMLPYFAAAFLFASGFALIGGMLATIAQVAGGRGGTAVVGLAMNLALVYAMIRLTMLGPVIAIEGCRHPAHALFRSWRLTRGNFLRLLLFLLLLVIASQVLTAVVDLLVGSAATLVGGPEAGRIAEAISGSVTMALFLLVINCVFAAIHRQLSAPEEAPGSLPFS